MFVINGYVRMEKKSKVIALKKTVRKQNEHFQRL